MRPVAAMTVENLLERLVASARDIDITNWSNDRLHHELNRVADAHDTLWTEGSETRGR